MRTGPALSIPDGLWERPSVARALTERDMQAVIKHFKQYTGASQTTVGALTGLAQSDISSIERGQRLVQSLEVLQRIATGLAIPRALLGLADPRPAPSATPPPALYPARLVPRAPDVSPPGGEVVTPGPGKPVADTVASVIRLGEWDVDRRQFLAASSAHALSVLALPDPESITRRTAAAAAGTAPVTVGRGEVAAVRQMTTVLGNAAAELGGGHARHLAVRYLTEDVAPWLKGTYTQATGRALFAAVSQLVHLAGWMSQDEGNQGLAQQYYGHSYRLAAEAGDAELSATALRGLAVQAIDLGHRAAAVRLAEESVRHTARLEEPRAVAYYQATLAHAAALDGDRRTATRALALSQHAIERAPRNPGESWAAHYSPGRWAHDTGMILAHLGDLDTAETHLHHALDLHGIDRRRTRAIVLADLGQVRLRRDDIDGALSTWNQFLDSADGLRSLKVHDALHDMRARLDHPRLHHVAGTQELKDRASALRV